MPTSIHLRLALVIVIAWSFGTWEASAQLPDTIDVRTVRAIAAFDDASAMDSDPAGNIYVTDRARDLVLRLNRKGKVVNSWGGPGSGNQSLDGPAGVDATNGLRILVADEGNGRVQWFTNEGVFVGSVPIQLPERISDAPNAARTERGRPVAVASENENDFFVLDGESGAVLQWNNNRSLKLIVDPHSSYSQDIRRPVALTVGDNRLFVADQESRSVFLFDRLGTFERTVCSNQCANVQSLSVVGERLVIVTSSEVRSYYLHGLLDTVSTIMSTSPVVALEATQDGWYILTQTALYGPF